MKKDKKSYETVYLEQKPYNEWSQSDIYYGIINYRRAKGLPALKRANIIPTFTGKQIRREFLKLTGSAGGRDLYGFDLEVIKNLTDESLEIAIAKHHPKNRPAKRPQRVRIEYIATWPDRYEIVEEDVDVITRRGGKWFWSSIDEAYHRLDEKGAKILDVIYNE